ncbi:DUF6932 family protein [Sphingomonas lacunae]|uniref:DUF6932 family protein n=1 Tax=Sphingomonas lacunae TaxID=2698828 RepID=UPI003CCDD10A
MSPLILSPSGAPQHILPPGLHRMALREFRAQFVTNACRSWIYDGFINACRSLHQAGCKRIFVGGSFVTSKEEPGDFDACWDPVGVLPSLDRIIYDESCRVERRQIYRGDLLIGGVDSVHYKFLARDKITGEERGMVGIQLRAVDLLNS